MLSDLQMVFVGWHYWQCPRKSCGVMNKYTPCPNCHLERRGIDCKVLACVPYAWKCPEEDGGCGESREPMCTKCQWQGGVQIRRLLNDLEAPSSSSSFATCTIIFGVLVLSAFLVYKLARQLCAKRKPEP